MKKLLIPAAMALALSPILAHAQSAGTVNLPTGTGINHPGTVSAAINSAMAIKADAVGGTLTSPMINSPTIISPNITGLASVPTAPAGDASNAPANTSWVAAAIAGLTGGVTGSTARTVSPTPFVTTGTGTIASALLLNYNENILTSCPAGTAAALPSLGVAPGQLIYVRNRSGSTCSILPSSANSQIESYGNNTAITITNGSDWIFLEQSATQWRD